MEYKIIGRTKDGEEIKAYTIQDPNGPMRLTVMNFGATALSIEVAAADGKVRDVVLGHAATEEYFDSSPYFGMTVARCANRIGGAQYTLNGKTYHTDKNDGNNTNHSGFHALCYRNWQVTDEQIDSITFSYDSPDGDMGFGGNMHIDVTYTLRDNAMFVDYHARADEDTIFNPTNHSYFNLKGQGKGNILDHSLIVYADEMLFANEESVPDGTIRRVSDTPLDFTVAKRIGDEIDADYDMLRFGKGYDHCFVLRGDTDDTTERLDKSLPLRGQGKRYGRLQKAATLIAPDRSLTLSVYTDLPGTQIYTGNYLEDGMKGKDGAVYCRRGGVAIETQFYPNAINIPAFPQPVIRGGEDYASRTVYAFS